MRRQLAGLTALQEGLSATAGQYRAARLRIVQLECEAAQAVLETARAVKKQRDFEEEQLAQLQASRSVSKQDATAAHLAAEAARYSIVQAEKNVQMLQEQIRCLRAGIAAGAGDGGNDLSYATQRLHELGCRIEEGLCFALPGRSEAGPTPAAHPRGGPAAVAAGGVRFQGFFSTALLNRVGDIGEHAAGVLADRGNGRNTDRNDQREHHRPDAVGPSSETRKRSRRVASDFIMLPFSK